VAQGLGGFRSSSSTRGWALVDFSTRGWALVDLATRGRPLVDLATKGVVFVEAWAVADPLSRKFYRGGWYGMVFFGCYLTLV